MRQTQGPYPESKALAAVHRSWGFPTDDELRWVLRQGVHESALVRPWPIGGANIRLLDGGTFDHDVTGARALTLRAEDRGEVIDLVAWEPSTGKLASWHGNTFCLGDFDQIYNPATYFMGGALRVHADPLDWLRANREGIVILRRDFAYAHLRFCPRILCDDLGHAEKVEFWLRAPEPTAEILIAEKAERQAA